MPAINGFRRSNKWCDHDWFKLWGAIIYTIGKGVWLQARTSNEK